MFEGSPARSPFGDTDLCRTSSPPACDPRGGCRSGTSVGRGVFLSPFQRLAVKPLLQSRMAGIRLSCPMARNAVTNQFTGRWTRGSGSNDLKLQGCFGVWRHGAALRMDQGGVMPPHSKGRIRHDMADCPDTKVTTSALVRAQASRGAVNLCQDRFDRGLSSNTSA